MRKYRTGLTSWQNPTIWFQVFKNKMFYESFWVYSSGALSLGHATKCLKFTRWILWNLSLWKKTYMALKRCLYSSSPLFSLTRMSNLSISSVSTWKKSKLQVKKRLNWIDHQNNNKWNMSSLLISSVTNLRIYKLKWPEYGGTLVCHLLHTRIHGRSKVQIRARESIYIPIWMRINWALYFLKYEACVKITSAFDWIDSPKSPVAVQIW